MMRQPVYFSDRARYRSPSRQEKPLRERYMRRYGNGNGINYPPPSGDFVFSARFLGSREMGAVEPAPEAVGQVVREMVESYRYSHYKPRRYHIVVQPKTIVVEEAGTDWTETIPVHAIQYCASDFQYPRAFSFVARSRQGYLCHLFYTKSTEVAEAISVSFARAFKRAYENYEDKRSMHHHQRRGRDSSSDEERMSRQRSRHSKRTKEYREHYDYDTQPAHAIYSDHTSRREPRPAMINGPPRSTRYLIYDDFPDDDRASTVDPIFSRRQGPTGDRLKRYDFVVDDQMMHDRNGFSDDMIIPSRRSIRSSSRRKENLYQIDDMELPTRTPMYTGSRRQQRYSSPYEQY